MLSKRIVVCLDIKDRKTTKGVKFKENVPVGDPVQMARRYYEEGADEIVFYDITASAESRKIVIELVRSVAREIFVPLTVGGGIESLEEMRMVLLAGAEKVSINTAAVKDPYLIREGARAFGSQSIVLGMDVLFVGESKEIPSGYEVWIRGGRTPTGMDALLWAKRAQSLGAGEICLNAIDTDGTQAGYELSITKMISENVSIPVVASGGAGHPEHLFRVLTEGKADAALIASMVHFGHYTIREIKEYLCRKGVKVRMRW